MLDRVVLTVALAGAQPGAPDPAALARALADSLRPLGVVAVIPGGIPGDTTHPLRAALAAALGASVAERDRAPRCRRAAPDDPRAGFAVSAALTRAPAGVGGYWTGRTIYVAVGLRCAGRPGAPRAQYAAEWVYALVPAGTGRWRVARRVGPSRVT